MGLLSLLPAPALRGLRRLLLRQGRRLGIGHMLAQSKRRAWKASTAAAQHSAAYRTLLEERGISLAELPQQCDWSRLPVLTKANTFERFALAQLSRPLRSSELADVLTSSAATGAAMAFGSLRVRNMPSPGSPSTWAFRMSSRWMSGPHCLPTACRWAWSSTRAP